jgi:Flp pilus assembly protein TadD
MIGCYPMAGKEIPLPAQDDQPEIQFQSGTVFKVDSCYLDTIKNILRIGIDGFVTEETNLADEAVAKQILEEAVQFSTHQKICANPTDVKRIEVFLYRESAFYIPDGWEVFARCFVYTGATKTRWVEYINYAHLEAQAIEKEKEAALNIKAALDHDAIGTKYYEAGENDKAISEFTRAIEKHPQDVIAYINRGTAYFSTRQYDKAVTDFNQAIKLSPEDARVFNNRASANEELGKFEEARADYIKAIQLDPMYAEAYFNRGSFYAKRGEYEKAIADFDKATEINPQYYKAYFNKAVAIERVGRWTEAIEAYGGFLRHAPVQLAAQRKHAQERIDILKSRQ